MADARTELLLSVCRLTTRNAARACGPIAGPLEAARPVLRATPLNQLVRRPIGQVGLGVGRGGSAVRGSQLAPAPT